MKLLSYPLVLIPTGLLALLIGVGVGMFLSRNGPHFLTPLGSQVLSSTMAPTTRLPTSYTVMGFLPYWLIKHIPDFQIHLLTHLAYFGVAINDQGQIETHLEDGTKELGLYRLQSNSDLQALLLRSQTAGVKNILVLRAMSTDAIQAAIAPETKSTLISEILTFSKRYQFAGINVDFEPTTETNPEAASQVTEFVAELANRCHQEIPDCEISIDIYASTPFNPRIWQLTELAAHVNHIVVMGYDFHRPSSANAGPNAPMRGAPDRWKYDLNSSIAKLTQMVPANQLVLAVPYYGYEWATLTDQPNSVVKPYTGRLATYTRVQELLTECFTLYSTCTRRIDEDSLSPYLIYQDDDQWYQVWYDDVPSLKVKYEFIKSANLSGTAIWALGYDAPHPDLWDLLQQQFFTTP